MCTKVTQKDISRSLFLLSPALPALFMFLLPPGQQLGAEGALSRVAVLFCSLFTTRGVFLRSFPFHTRTLAPFPSTAPSPCLTWIPGSLYNFLLGSPASLSLLTSVYFCSFSGPQECLSCFWAQLCLFSALKIFINVMWIGGQGAQIVAYTVILARNLT